MENHSALGPEKTVAVRRGIPERSLVERIIETPALIAIGIKNVLEEPIRTYADIPQV